MDSASRLVLVVSDSASLQPASTAGPVRAAAGAYALAKRGCGGSPSATRESPSYEIERIPKHLGGGESVDPAHPRRAPPQGDLLF
jgi:hypothetical protein